MGRKIHFVEENIFVTSTRPQLQQQYKTLRNIGQVVCSDDDVGDDGDMTIRKRNKMLFAGQIFFASIRN